MLNQSPGGARWEVMNLGVSGSNTSQEMLLYREVASQYHPDIVLCAFFVGNDLSDNSPRMSNCPRVYFDLDEAGQLVQLPFSTSRHLLTSWLNRYSRFYVWQKEATNHARHRICESAGLLSPGDWIFCSRESEDVAHAWALAAALLRQFQQEVENRGSLFAVILVPSAAEICRRSLPADHRAGRPTGTPFPPRLSRPAPGGNLPQGGHSPMVADLRLPQRPHPPAIPPSRKNNSSLTVLDISTSAVAWSPQNPSTTS